MPEIEKFQKRQIAYKIRIKDILSSKYIKTEGFDPNYLEVNSQQISRMNIVGVVVQKSELNNYKTLAIDDGTGKISARVFESNPSVGQIDVGDIVIVIGRPREFSSEKYILIEIIKKIDPSWAKVRKLELEKNTKKSGNPANDTSSAEDVVVDLSPANRIFKLIKELDQGSGVSIEELSSENIKDVDKLIGMLLKEGDIFEIRPGKLKVLE